MEMCEVLCNFSIGERQRLVGQQENARHALQLLTSEFTPRHNLFQLFNWHSMQPVRELFIDHVQMIY